MLDVVRVQIGPIIYIYIYLLFTMAYFVERLIVEVEKPPMYLRLIYFLHTRKILEYM
jgi:hypothetical protein